MGNEYFEELWCGITNDFPKIRLHEFVVMPNHIHGIIEIAVVADSISAHTSISARDNTDLTKRVEIDSPPTVVNIPKIIQSFKRHTTIEYIKMVKKNIVPPFDKRIWQRNYYDHIIRNEKSYVKITEYILNNPLKWSMDEYHI